MTPVANEKGLVWLNVASSTLVEPNFINLDNHYFLPFASWPNALTRFFPKRYRDSLVSYREAMAKAVLARHDCRKPLPFADKSVDHVLCSHFLEHVYPEEAAAILRDFRRVLKPEGTLHVIVPDLEIHVQDYLNRKKAGHQLAGDAFIEDTLLSKRTRGSAAFRLMDGLGAFGLMHLWVYDQDTIAKLVADAGFAIDPDLPTPSDYVRTDDGISTHVRARP